MKMLTKKDLAAAIFLFLVIAVFSGTVYADATIDLYYTDAGNNPVSQVKVGEPIASNIVVQNHENPSSNVVVEQSYHNNNQWTNDEYYYVSMDGGNSWVTNPSAVNTRDGGFTWTIGSLLANQRAILRWPGTPVSAGSEVMNVELFVNQLLGGTDTASLTIAGASDSAGAGSKTVGMQETGSPLTFLILAFALISGGLLFSRKH